MSLRWRIALALAVIAALVGSGAAVGSYVATSRQLARSLDESLLQLVDRVNPPRGPALGGGGSKPRSVRGDFDDGPGGSGRTERCPTAAVQPSAGAQLVRADGSVEACYEGGLTLPVDAADQRQARDGGPPRLRTVSVDGRDYRMLSVSWHHGGLVQAARSFAEANQVLGALRWRLGALVASAVAVAALIGWWFAGRIVGPVERLRAAAERVASTGDLTTAVPAKGPGEVGSLAASFTTMMAGLATSREQQQRLVTDASHELRTPLTSLRTNIELLERAESLPAAQRGELVRGELLSDVRLELDELTHLVEELVELATDRSGPAEQFETVQLAEVAEAVASRARRRSGRRIEVVASEPAEVQAIRPLLERAVSNLVENAVKYSRAPGAVEVHVHGARLEVRDEGPGIDPADRPHVFERFYRATAARTSAGSGLGLAIVKQVVDRHGGRVWATNAPSGGAAVGFDLPARPTD